MADDQTTGATAENTTPAAAAQNTDPQAAPQNTPANQPGKPGTQETKPGKQEKAWTQPEIDKLVSRIKRETREAVSEEVKTELENAGKPEIDQLRTALATEQAKRQELLADVTLTTALADQTRNLKAALLVVKPALKFSKSGEITNLDDAIAAARVLAPELFLKTQGTIDAGAGGGTNTPGATPSMNDLIRGGARGR